ncbi:MAG: DoxX family membrane protein [Propioniciclava sp.]
MTQWPDARPRDEDREPTVAVPVPAPDRFGEAASPDSEATAALPASDLPPDGQPTQAFVPPADEVAHRTAKLPTSDLSSDSEPTQALAPPPPNYVDHRTAVLPTMNPPAPAQPWPSPGRDPVPPPEVVTGEGSAGDEFRASDAWAWQMSRTQNRASTDIGLLLLRLSSLPLVLHAMRQLLTFGEFVAQVRGNPVGAAAPELIAIGVIVAQALLPVLLALGFVTRVAAALQAMVMVGIYTVVVLTMSPVVDPATGALSGEATLAYAALALPLVLTGPGRFSLDHGLTSERRERAVQRRVERHRHRGNV